jgi:hypothetical protein
VGERIDYRFRVPDAAVFTLYSYSKALDHRFCAVTGDGHDEMCHSFSLAYHFPIARVSAPYFFACSNKFWCQCMSSSCNEEVFMFFMISPADLLTLTREAQRQLYRLVTEWEFCLYWSKETASSMAVQSLLLLPLVSSLT